jgi:tetratricopeptide (TPR) repeat protein
MRLRLLLALGLLLAPAAASADWQQASSTHFVVYSEGSAESVGAFATRLERFDKALRVLNHIPDEDLGPANRVTVFVLPDVEAVRNMISPGSSIAGFYVGTPRRAGGDSILDLDAETILLHEYAHHFMSQNYSSAYPPWFIEGFAEFNSTATFAKDGSVDLGRPANHRAAGLYFTDAMPIEAIFDSADRKFTGPQWEATIYGRGWLLTHYLNFEPKRAGQLRAYLRGINSGKTSLVAARDAFGDLKVLDRELKAYLAGRRMQFRTIPAPALTIGPVTVRPLTPGEAAMMPIRMKSKRGVDRAKAKELVAPMRRVAGRFPAEAAVQAALAEVEYDAGNLDEADAAVARALAVQPANIDALTYKARVAMARAEANPSADAPAWLAVRRLILAANKVDPNDPEPFMLYYQSYGSQGIAPTRNAVEGLLRAFELAPHDGSLRQMVGFQYLVDGKKEEAHATLAPLAFDPHGGDGAKRMRGILARLEEGGTQAALAAWSDRSDPALDAIASDPSR